jgi:hypothetical protein
MLSVRQELQFLNYYYMKFMLQRVKWQVVHNSQIYVAAPSSILERGPLALFVRNIETFTYNVLFHYCSSFICLNVVPCRQSGVSVDRNDESISFSEL